MSHPRKDFLSRIVQRYNVIMPIHVVLHFLDPIDKTFGFTEPNTLELGRSSGFIENETLSRKQGKYL